MRVAVGAARGRVLRQLLTENLALAMLGGVLGAVLAVSASPLLTRLVPSGLPLTGTPDIDLRVLAFAITVTLSTTIVFGVGPAWRLSRLADLSESLADAFWPGTNKIGQRITVGPAGDRTVVGVAANIAVRSLEGAGRYGRHQIYLPFDQLGKTNAYYAPKDLLVHTSGDPRTLVPALRTIIHEVDPEQAISNVRLLQDIVADQTAPRRDQLLVLGIFSAIASLLSMTGIYGLLAFIVAARTQELGVRVALGAARGDILRMFLRQGLALGIGGVVLAIPLAYAAARGLGALLFGVYPGDPIIYGSSALLAMLMTLAGSLRPAIRASSINPASTIRAE